MIRSILMIIYFIIIAILSLPLLLIFFIVGLFKPEAKANASLFVVKIVFNTILFIAGVKLTVIGEENVPTDRPVFYVGNHRSYFDTVMTMARVPRVTCYVAKKQVKSFPILNLWMMNLHCLFLDRDDIKQGLKTIIEAIDLIKNGTSVCIFPEGTRSRVPDEFLPFKEGSFKVATKSGAPIVPMTIVNSSSIFEDHIPFLKKSKVILEYGKPIYPEELEKEELKKIGAYTENIIKETYFKNKELLKTL
ncbi:MAG: 1-acyl-sn-glycerol-3-phosphate acyltransferase [Lachnospiraceae bacterium]|nr:1-acyl-sn-glycerol-3-phosphate acyltransferase [Lachnospiraceae bacterium]